MNKDFAVWWLENKSEYLRGHSPHDFDDLEGFAKDLAEDAWNAATKAANDQWQINSGRG